MTNAEALDLFVSLSEKEVGVKEEGGNNIGRRIHQYQEATWLTPAPWPWCAAFVCWVMREWLDAPGVIETLGIPLEAVAGWRCKDASAYGFEKWAVKKNLLLLTDQDAPKRGDIVTFDFSHVGIVARVLNGHIETIEGNTNGKGERDSAEGDGVWRKVRPISLARRFVRMLP